MLAYQAAAWVLDRAREAVAHRGAFHLVLAGGTTPRGIYGRLARSEATWGAWHVWFGDERCLPQGDVEPNDAMAEAALLATAPIPAGQVHCIPAEAGPQAGAARYAEALAGLGPFDLVLLGLGEDGHTASLFPGHHHPPELPVVPVTRAPKPPAERVSLGLGRLVASRSLFLLATGAGKRNALASMERGDPALPATRLSPACGTDVMVDRPAFPWEPIGR